MKKHVVIIIYHFLICLISYGQENWISQQSKTTILLNDVFFANADTGWVVGNNGTILSTVNSGNDWTNQSSPIMTNLKAIYFINSNTGWIVGENGALLYTVNGGETWNQKQTEIEASIHDIFFINDSTGWLCSDGNPSIYKTIDKGDNWIAPCEGMPGNTTIFFSNENTGWTAIGSAINKTTDGGENWNMTILENANIHSIYFFDKNHGYCVGSPFCAFKTTNGGENWEALTIQDCLWLNDVFFISENIGWTVGDGIYQTMDGGSNWEKTYTNPISAVYFPDSQKGWAVGESGTIIHQSLGTNSLRQYENVENFIFIYSSKNDIMYIEYTIQNPCNTNISIYDLKGEIVLRQLSESSNIGKANINLSLNNLKRGVYICYIKIGEFIYTKKIIK